MQQALHATAPRLLGYLMSGGDCVHGIGHCLLPLAQHDRVIRLLHAVPAVVTVHREIAARDGGDLHFCCDANGNKLTFKILTGMHRH